ncbi:hypothetical protein [Maioricimonas sp. JC845]|uniref:hypothetical protein n=1 Tax=Maioricimonas sp. JC845 TaxID=3232138 RepID=UPI0034594601
MFSFVICGAIQDPRNIPAGLMILAIAALMAGVFWVAGLQSGKSNEYSVWGLVAGVLIGVGMTFWGQPGAAVYTNSGNISQTELTELRQRRVIANQFVADALLRTNENNPFVQFQIAQLQFGFQRPGDTSDRDVIAGEMLRREGRRLGIEVPREAVTEFINAITNRQMTANLFKEIRQRLQLSEGELVEILQDEILARNVAGYLFGGSILPPETYWEFYRKLNEQVTAELVVVPVEDFVPPDLEPTDDQLQELFVKYRNNLPNRSAEGQIVEGQPGFFQPRKVRLAYLEAAYDDVEALVGEVTDEEIEQYYEEQYKRVPANLEGSMVPGGAAPEFPGSGPQLTPPGDATPKPESTDTPETPAESPSETPAADSTEAPATDEAPKSDAPKEDAAEGDAAPSEEMSALPGTDSETILGALSDAQPVLLQDEEADDAGTEAADDSDEKPADEKPAEPETPAEDKPAEPETPAEKPADAPAGDAPAPEKADDKKPDTDTPDTDTPDTAKPADGEPADDKPAADGTPTTPPAAADPPAPPQGVRPLDAELRLEIRDRILRERTLAKMEELTEEAYNYMANEIGFYVNASEDDPAHISPEDAAAKLKAYADEHGLIYMETPLLTYTELATSEDYPIGQAADPSNPRSASVANDAFSTSPQDVYRPRQAVDIGTDSRFSYWKTEDVAAHVPESLEEDGVREQVAEAFRLQEARPKAEERADALARLASDSDKPFLELLSEQTVDGREGSLFLNPREVGPFSWMRRSTAVSPNSFQQPPPELTQIPGLNDLGDDFMKTVFNDLQAGEVGVAANADRTEYYVVRIARRTPSGEEELKKFRDGFLAESTTSFSEMERQERREFGTNWLDRLFEKHDVRIAERETPAEQY